MTVRQHYSLLGPHSGACRCDAQTKSASRVQQLRNPDVDLPFRRVTGVADHDAL